MTNAERFRGIFGKYATELWAMSEPEFLAWLNAEAEPQPSMCWSCNCPKMGDEDDERIHSTDL